MGMCCMVICMEMCTDMHGHMYIDMSRHMLYIKVVQACMNTECL